MNCYTFIPKLLNMTLTASVVICVVLVLRLFLKKAPKVISYALWVLVLFRLLCPISFQSSFSAFSLMNIPTASQGENSSVMEYIPENIVHTEYPVVTFPIPALSGIINETLPQGEEQVRADPLEGVTFLATLVWIFGVAGMLVYSLISYLSLREKLQIVVPLRDNIYTADDIGSPFVVGLLRPRIYLPCNLNEKEQEYIILHEQFHIKRLDHIFKAVAFLALTVHWFNPLVWLAFILASKDMEMSCDEAVIGKMGSDIRADYSASLLALATGRRIIAGTPLAFGEGDTADRIKNLSKWKKPAFWIIVVAVMACVVVGVCFLTNPRTDFTIDRADVEKVTYYNQFVGDDCQGELNSAQVDEMVGRFSAVSKAKRSNHYEGQSPGYQLCVFLENGSFVYANGYDALEDNVEIIYNDKRYAVTDTEFASYLRNVCSAGDISSAQEIPSKIRINVSDEIINNVPAAVLDYAKDYVAQEVDLWNNGNFEDGIAVQHINKVTEAKITGITRINTGTAALDYSINMYLLEYRLLPEDQDNIVLAGGMRADLIDGRSWLTEWGSTGQPYLLLLAEDDNWTRICVTNTDSIDFDYGTPEMLEQYGDKYTAAAMELYEKTKTENLIYVQSAGSTIQPVLSFAYSEKWTENGFLCVDGGPVLNELTEWSEATYLPALVYSEDFTVSYADKVSFRYVIPFDESKNQMDHLYDITELENLDPGRYFIGIVVNQEGDYIEPAKQSECTGWTCLFRLTVE